MKRKSNPLSVEDLLQDNTVETKFPNAWCLMKIYVLIPMSKAIGKRGFSKMGQIITKKGIALDNNSLEIWMCILYHKQSLKTYDVKPVLELWRYQKERWKFSSDF